MSSEPQGRLQAEIDRLRARIAELERTATERMQVEYALGRERETSRRQTETEQRTRAAQQAAVAELGLPESVQAAHTKHRTSYFAEPRVRQMGRDLVLAGRRKDGTELPLEISLSYIETPDGLLAMGFVTDITERVELQRAG